MVEDRVRRGKTWSEIRGPYLVMTHKIKRCLIKGYNWRVSERVVAYSIYRVLNQLLAAGNYGELLKYNIRLMYF